MTRAGLPGRRRPSLPARRCPRRSRARFGTWLLGAALLALAAPAAGETIHLRVNQVGYRPGHPVVALALSDASLGGRRFEVRPEAGGPAVAGGPVGRDRGRWGAFAHVYELDAGALDAEGRFVVQLGGTRSPAFAVGVGAGADLPGKSLRFFRVQRCGATGPLDHGACHLQDGVARGGPADGSPVDAAGGWHDAGDYIKYLITVGYATHLMLATWTRHSGVFPDDDGDGTPDVLDEARVGLDWIASRTRPTT